MKIGVGYDVHKLVEGRKLILGGVEIAHDKGLLGHSDADVLVHALIDAILGAVNEGDIGQLFPDTDKKFKNIDSRILLRRVHEIMNSAGFKIGNIDATICAQKPKLQTHILMMRKNIAEDLNCKLRDVSVKATTEEGLGVSGKEQGMSTYCVVLLEKK